MATATLRKRSAKPHANGRLLNEFDDDFPTAFCMPVGSMTLEEFRHWTWSEEFPTTGSIAYLGKEIFFDMSPERMKSHGSVKTAIGGTIIPLVFKKDKGELYFDRTRVVNVNANVSNEPDGVLVTWESFDNATVRLVPTKDGDDFIELEGSPDWILEVVSPSSVTKDKKTLRECYFKAGVSEYWLVDARGDEVDFQILIRGNDDFLPASEGTWQHSKLFGKKFRLRRITNRAGRIDYRLDVK